MKKTILLLCIFSFVFFLFFSNYTVFAEESSQNSIILKENQNIEIISPEDVSIRIECTGKYDYVLYASDNSIINYSKDRTSSLTMKGGQRLVITNTNSDAIEVIGISDIVNYAFIEDEALSKFDLEAGKSYEFNSRPEASKIYITNNGKSSSGSPQYEYVKYDANGKYSWDDNEYRSIELESGGRTIVTVLGENNLSCWYPREIFLRDVTYKEITGPALHRFELEAGKSYEFRSRPEASKTYITNNGKSSSGSPQYEYVKYDANGKYSWDDNEYRSIELESGGRTIVTVLGENNLSCWYPREIFLRDVTYKEITGPALHRFELEAGKSYEFRSRPEASKIYITNNGKSSSGSPQYEYVKYYANGKYSWDDDEYRSIELEAGGRTIVTVLGENTLSCWYPRELFSRDITYKEVTGRALHRFELEAGKSYIFVNNSNEYSIDITTDSSNSNNNNFSYVTLDSSGETNIKNNSTGKIYIKPGGKTIATVTGVNNIKAHYPREIYIENVNSYETPTVNFTYPSQLIHSRYNPGVSSQFDDFYGQYDISAWNHEKVDPEIVLIGPDTERSFVSLPTGSYVVLGFETPIININGVPDIFIRETGIAYEEADIYVSTIDGNLVYIGMVIEDAEFISIDLDNIGFTSPIIAVMIVGKDEGGNAPGFDIVQVFGMNDSSVSYSRNEIEAAFSKIKNSLAEEAKYTGMTKESIEKNEQIDTYDRINSSPESIESDPIDTATGAQIINQKLLTVYGARNIDFSIKYNSLLLKEGPLGKSWGHSFEAKLEKVDEDNIIVYWTANNITKYVRNSEGVFEPLGISNHYDKLTVNDDGTILVARRNKESFKFDVNGKLREILNINNQSLELNYYGDGNLESVVEPISGKSIVFKYDELGFLVKVIDDLERNVVFEYDEDNNLIRVTDPSNNFITYEYNDKGQISASRDSLGNRIFRNTFDEYGRVVIQDDGVDGNTLTMFQYDETTEPGNIITTVTDRNGESKALTHDLNYNIIKVKDKLGNITEYRYDQYGNRINEIDPQGNITSYKYDERGNLILITDPLGRVVSMTYDKNDNLLSIEDSLGNKTEYKYDKNNNIVSIVDANNNEFTYDYDENGQLILEKYPNGRTKEFFYEKGLLTEIVEENGNSTTYGYDSSGRIISITDSMGHTTRYRYDNLDNITVITDPLGNTHRYTYDMYGNVTRETDPNGNTSYYRYNGNRKLIEKIDPDYNKIQYKYDGEDRLIEVIDQRENSMKYKYDGNGRLLSTTDALGNTFTYEYDSLGRLTKEHDAKGNLIRKIKYDQVGNIIEILDGLSNQTSMIYDEANRLVKSIDSLGREKELTYDKLSRLTSVIDPLSKVSEQGFDTMGNRIYIIDPNGNKTEFRYDLSGRLVAEINATNNEINYVYNSVNLVTKIINGRGQETTFTYDDSGRVKSIIDNIDTVSYSYDSNGNVTSIADSLGTIYYEYDSFNRVTRYTDIYGNQIKYGYDEVGNLTKLIYPDGKEVIYNYDKANRLIEVIDWASRKTTYEYDENSKLVKEIRPNGTVKTISYDVLGRTKSIEDITSDGSIINQYYFVYDEVGNVLEEATNFELSNIDIDSITMTYSKDNQLDTFNGQEVKYDNDGNMIYGPLNGELAHYEYDQRNRLINVENIEYFYDANNNRVAIRSNGDETKFVISPIAALSQTLLKEDSTGKKTYYIYGIGLIGQEDSEGHYLTYHYDRRGSTVALTDENGNITDEFYYSPFGKLVSHEGSTETSFLYNGRDGVMTDENGLYYMRARYYTPEARRFINRDTIIGSIENGQGLNRFAYVQGNPVMFIDPTGEWLGLDDLIVSGVGALAGVIGQYGSDVIGNIVKDGFDLTDFTELSDWENYVGSAIGGAAAGETLLYTANPIAAGAVGGATGNASTQGLKLLTGKQNKFSVGELLVETGVGGIMGAIPVDVKINGITKGRGSYGAVYKSGLTRLKNGTASRMSKKVMFKGLTYTIVGDLPSTAVNSLRGGLKARFGSNRDITYVK